EVSGNQGVRRGDRGCGNADVHGSKGQKRVSNTVVAKNRSGPILAAAVLEKPARNGVDLLNSLPVSDAGPLSIWASFHQEWLLRSRRCPVFEPVSQAAAIMFEWLCRTKDRAAVGALEGLDGARSKQGVKPLVFELHGFHSFCGTGV